MLNIIVVRHSTYLEIFLSDVSMVLGLTRPAKMNPQYACGNTGAGKGLRVRENPNISFFRFFATWVPNPAPKTGT